MMKYRGTKTTKAIRDREIKDMDILVDMIDQEIITAETNKQDTMGPIDSIDSNMNLEETVIQMEDITIIEIQIRAIINITNHEIIDISSIKTMNINPMTITNGLKIKGSPGNSLTFKLKPKISTKTLQINTIITDKITTITETIIRTTKISINNTIIKHKGNKTISIQETIQYNLIKDSSIIDV